MWLQNKGAFLEEGGWDIAWGTADIWWGDEAREVGRSLMAKEFVTMLGASYLWAEKGERGKAVSKMMDSMVQDGRRREGAQWGAGPMGESGGAGGKLGGWG